MARSKEKDTRYTADRVALEPDGSGRGSLH
jgi:hypothetical protein